MYIIWCACKLICCPSSPSPLLPPPYSPTPPLPPPPPSPVSRWDCTAPLVPPSRASTGSAARQIASRVRSAAGHWTRCGPSVAGIACSGWAEGRGSRTGSLQRVRRLYRLNNVGETGAGPPPRHVRHLIFFICSVLFCDSENMTMFLMLRRISDGIMAHVSRKQENWGLETDFWGWNNFFFICFVQICKLKIVIS